MQQPRTSINRRVNPPPLNRPIRLPSAPLDLSAALVVEGGSPHSTRFSSRSLGCERSAGMLKFLPACGVMVLGCRLARALLPIVRTCRRQRHFTASGRPNDGYVMYQTVLSLTSGISLTPPPPPPTLITAAQKRDSGCWHGTLEKSWLGKRRCEKGVTVCTTWGKGSSCWPTTASEQQSRGGSLITWLGLANRKISPHLRCLTPRQTWLTSC
jgi:hypothetical protein